MLITPNVDDIKYYFLLLGVAIIWYHHRRHHHRCRRHHHHHHHHDTITVIIIIIIMYDVAIRISSILTAVRVNKWASIRAWCVSTSMLISSQYGNPSWMRTIVRGKLTRRFVIGSCLAINNVFVHVCIMCVYSIHKQNILALWCVYSIY